MNNMIQLSRYLYIIDEVILTFTTSLLNKRTIEECLFWFSEFYYSGYEEDSWYLLGSIYKDYYAVLNPKIEDLIINKYNKWNNDNNILHLIYIIKNLYNKKHNNKIFILRQYLYSNIESNIPLIRGRKPVWLVNYNKDYHNIIHSIHKNNYKLLCYCLRYITDDKLDNLYLSIIKYFKDIHKIDIKYNDEELVKYINNICDTYPVIDKNKHKKDIILSIIIYFKTDASDINLKQIRISPNKELLKYVDDINNCVDKVYNTLREKLKYSISNNIGCFNLDRFKIDNIKDEILMNWDNYIYNTPIWNTRIKLLHGYMLDNKLVFKTDDHKDNFYNKYGYYPDEISDYYYNRIVLPIDKLSVNIESNIIDLPHDFSFNIIY